VVGGFAVTERASVFASDADSGAKVSRSFGLATHNPEVAAAHLLWTEGAGFAEHTVGRAVIPTTCGVISCPG
jgi:hypothetical protein